MERVIDVAKDPYGRSFYAAQKRRAFEKLKKTKAFKEWKQKQLLIQEGKCAYCGISLSFRDIVTHVDHVQPLYFEGTNNFDNLVLSCRRCNLRKWINNNRVVPEWIRKRGSNIEAIERLRSAREEQAKIMEELVNQELDDQILAKLQDWV